MEPTAKAWTYSPIPWSLWMLPRANFVGTTRWCTTIFGINDMPAQPILITLRRGGREIPAVAQMTKMGFVFIFDRLTGKPLFPVEERRVPESNVPGEAAWATQPFPLKPPPLV